VKTHLASIFRRLGATSRTQAVVAAARMGLRLGPWRASAALARSRESRGCRRKGPPKRARSSVRASSFQGWFTEKANDLLDGITTALKPMPRRTSVSNSRMSTGVPPTAVVVAAGRKV
jgi:hypothetical protein